MNKAIQAFLTGMFITFILDFFLFLGILLNYINFYNIELYYNILFADNQNGYLFFGLTLILGYIIVYLNNYKISLLVTGVLSFLVLLTLFQGIGHSVGEALFMKKETILETSKRTYSGDILYDGREYITFYEHNLNKIIKISKKDLKK
ncbi:MAG: hypothetical protein RQ763_01080 [Sulfurimonas sp.]|uniref:hypothetical protein n=1 Tax=Sulfurimonas sp. TaxID=2022749 RepID=UPI0028CED71E|nr:hypothetical protein [Sulfurimonas sp.]MDT8337769.1 hypothetical protein [Sulfurimonas sp.]